MTVSNTNNNNNNNNNNALVRVQQPEDAFLLCLPKDLINYVFYYLSSDPSDLAKFERTCLQILDCSRGSQTIHWALYPEHFLNLLSGDLITNRELAIEAAKKAFSKAGLDSLITEKLENHFKDQRPSFYSMMQTFNADKFATRATSIIKQLNFHDDVTLIEISLKAIQEMIEAQCNGNPLGISLGVNSSSQIVRILLQDIVKARLEELLASIKEEDQIADENSIVEVEAILQSSPELQKILKQLGLTYDVLIDIVSQEAQADFFQESTFLTLVNNIKDNLEKSNPEINQLRSQYLALQLANKLLTIAFCNKVLLKL